MKRPYRGFGKSVVVCLVLSLFGLSFHIVTLLNRQNAIYKGRTLESTGNENEMEMSVLRYLVDTPKCKLPDLDPFDSSVQHLLVQGVEYTCDKFLPITYMDGSILHINWTAVRESAAWEDFDHCEYQVIQRPTIAPNHNFYDYQYENNGFNSSVKIFGDFIRVRCYNSAGGLVYTNFHHVIHKKTQVEKRCRKSSRKHMQKDRPQEKLNVVMLGVDSVSRLNFMRYMKNTRSYLLHELEAIELVGYNKVADNTFVNIVPMTMGKFLEEVPWNETMSNIPFDKYEFLWKQFSDKGYRTLYAEDEPNIAIFDYLKAGFHKAPGDYFNRHYSLAMTRESGIWYNKGKCVGNKLETETVLDFTRDFMTTFRGQPNFAFSFVTGLTHDVLENSAAADRPYLEFLESVKSSGALDNTVLFLFSDHGMRFGSVRETYIGKMEERLPFMFIVFPPWLLKKYPKFARNLRINSHRLTTPFDIYETVRDILYFKNKTTPFSNDRGVSLFNRISSERSCDSAGILPHWCTCAVHDMIPTNDDTVRQVASVLIQRLNNVLQHFQNICEILYLDKIIRASKLLTSNKVLSFRQSLHDVINRTVSYGDRVKTFVDYQISIKTQPGGGVFEATIRYNEMDETYSFMGDISRINLYGQQSKCISEHRLKKFCYCK